MINEHRHNLLQPDIGLSGLTAGKTSLRGKKTCQW
jgi:hypothetical protein